MSLEAPHESELPAGLTIIEQVAHQTAVELRNAGLPIQTEVLKHWQELNTSMTQEEGRWVASYQAYKTFTRGLSATWQTVPNEGISQLRQLAESRGPLDENWYILSSFLLHDIHHLDPSMLFTIFHSVENGYQQTGQVMIFDRHKQFLDTIIHNLDTFVSIKALPVEFITGVVALEQQRPLPVEYFSPTAMMGRIARLIQGRFAMDDYHVTLNETPQSEQPTNYIHIDAPENMVVQTNQAMLFSVIYNLAKNAAKANGIAHHAEKDQAAHKAYYQGGSLEHPRTLTLAIEETATQVIMSVADAGDGLSIDMSLKRIQQIMADYLETIGPDKLQQTEWYKQMRRALGDEQVDLLFAWPKNPYALRDIKVGTIFDCQFVAGFGPQMWNIPSLTSGMGLWGVRYITERLGGTVMATNTFDQGALFSIFLPKTSLGLEQQPINAAQTSR